MQNGNSNYPARLREIIEFFDFLGEDEKRENLIAYSDNASKQEPRKGETFDLQDVRKDAECTDTVGVYLKVDRQNEVIFRITLGPQVQTLTRAMTAILCAGLNGASPESIVEIPQDFVPRIVGGELVRLRSQTVYYVLGRMKGACRVYLRRRLSVKLTGKGER